MVQVFSQQKGFKLI